MFAKLKTFALAFAAAALCVTVSAQEAKTVTVSTDKATNTVKAEVKAVKTEVKASVDAKTCQPPENRQVQKR